VTNLGLNLLLVPSIGWIGAALATTASAAVGLVIGYRRLREVLEFGLPLGEIGRQAVAALAMGGAVYAGRTLLGDSLAVVLLLVGGGGALYVLVLLRISTQFRRTVFDNVSPLVPRL
jgi:O-antigen/teichoic acid export membrane protein